MFSQKLYKKIILITTLISCLFIVTPAIAAYPPSGVHTHTSNTTLTSEPVYADVINPDPDDKLTSVTIDGLLQDDMIIVYKYNYDGSSAGQETFYSLPITFSPNCFKIKFSLATGSNEGCRYAYYSEATEDSGTTAYWDPLDPHPSLTPDSPSDDGEEPLPPPPLPPAPNIPDVPQFNVTQPVMPAEPINIPEPGEFDGTYNYQEPDRQGAYTYTPPPLDIPDPIPSPPPPPAGPGLFDFSSIMQPLGSKQEQKPLEQPAAVSTPITQSTPVSKTTPKTSDTPKTLQSPIAGESPGTRDLPGAVAPANVSTPIGVAPALQPTAPLPVQPGVVQPAVMDEPLSKSTPLVPSDPLTPEPPAGQ